MTYVANLLVRRALGSVALAAASVFGLCACGPLGGVGVGPPANVAGVYSMAVTNGANGCMLDGWAVGNSASGIDFNVTQSGASVQGTVGGLTGVFFNVVLGTNRLAGTVGGNVANMTLSGMRAGTSGACAFTGAVDMVGTLTWRYSTNNPPDCGYRTSCTSEQTFSGSRPPPSGG